MIGQGLLHRVHTAACLAEEKTGHKPLLFDLDPKPDYDGQPGVQVVYSGAVEGAADFFQDLGYSPHSPEVNIADYMLDVVIRSPPDDVEHMVAQFKR